MRKGRDKYRDYAQIDPIEPITGKNVLADVEGSTGKELIEDEAKLPGKCSIGLRDHVRKVTLVGMLENGGPDRLRPQVEFAQFGAVIGVRQGDFPEAVDFGDQFIDDVVIAAAGD